VAAALGVALPLLVLQERRSEGCWALNCHSQLSMRQDIVLRVVLTGHKILPVPVVDQWVVLGVDVAAGNSLVLFWG